MATWNSIYVPVDQVDLTEQITRTLRKKYVLDGDERAGIVLHEDASNPPCAQLADLSARFHTELFWLSLQSTAGAFQYHHWHHGVCVRSLVYGCRDEERTWELVEGIPEPWEQERLFGSGRLQFELRLADREDERLEVSRIYGERLLVVGSPIPGIDPHDVCLAVAGFYRFPGWGPPEKGQ